MALRHSRSSRRISGRFGISFYFSAITQFTVGYGDILPNATSVRLVVVLQTFVAALLLVVVLNLTFRN